MDDIKIQVLEPDMFKLWINLLLCAARHDDAGGSLPPICTIAFWTRSTAPIVESGISYLYGAGLLEKDGSLYRVHDWAEWQPPSDKSTARVRAHRARKAKRNGGETFHSKNGTATKRPCNALETETETETENINSAPLVTTKSQGAAVAARRVKVFTKPTVIEVAAYCQERQNRVNAQAFVDHYESNGWRVGRTPMKDWRAAVRTWERSEFATASKPKSDAGRPLPINPLIDRDAYRKGSA